MTKNGRRALFLLVATAANMLLTVIIIVVLFIALNALSMAIGLKGLGGAIIIFSFLAGVILSAFAYSRVLKALRRRPGLEERFGLLK
jgi:UDP-N-acetylmuramyl pentapeptide phosphotransferase/UDP-N-acetylglucosamine-1-phosphate transferase